MGEAIITRRGGQGTNIEILSQDHFEIKSGVLQSIKDLDFSRYTYIINVGGYIGNRATSVSDVFVIKDGYVVNKRYGLAIQDGVSTDNIESACFEISVHLTDKKIHFFNNKEYIDICATSIIAIS